jgi:hypothetical protein
MKQGSIKKPSDAPASTTNRNSYITPKQLRINERKKKEGKTGKTSSKIHSPSPAPSQDKSGTRAADKLRMRVQGPKTIKCAQ